MDIKRANGVLTSWPLCQRSFHRSPPFQRILMEDLSLPRSEVQHAFRVALGCRICFDLQSSTPNACHAMMSGVGSGASRLHFLCRFLPTAALRCGELQHFLTKMHQRQATPFGALVLQMTGNTNLIVFSNEITHLTRDRARNLNTKFWLCPELVLQRSVFLLTKRQPFV